jgi:hypothetical protein
LGATRQQDYFSGKQAEEKSNFNSLSLFVNYHHAKERRKKPY